MHGGLRGSARRGLKDPSINKTISRGVEAFEKFRVDLAQLLDLLAAGLVLLEEVLLLGILLDLLEVFRVLDPLQFPLGQLVFEQGDVVHQRSRVKFLLLVLLVLLADVESMAFVDQGAECGVVGFDELLEVDGLVLEEGGVVARDEAFEHLLLLEDLVVRG